MDANPERIEAVAHLHQDLPVCQCHFIRVHWRPFAVKIRFIGFMPPFWRAQSLLTSTATGVGINFS